MSGKLNACSGSGTYVGGNMGGHRYSANAYGTCPVCAKRIQVTNGGRIRSHGTRSAPAKPAEEKADHAS